MSTSKLSKVFIGLIEFSPHLKKILWHWFYNQLAVKDKAGQLLFMNYGYAIRTEQAGKFELALSVEDEPFRYTIQLYQHVVAGLDLDDKEIVEIGCGRGGGGSFLLRYHKPRFYTGVDLSESAIQWCKQQMQFPSARWLQASASTLPIENSSVDRVINVESSHCYPSMTKFLGEVVRILRPGGYFAFCDMRTLEGVKQLEQEFLESKLKVLKQQIITPEVLRALDLVSQQRQQQILSSVPRFLQSAFRDFVGVQDSGLYKMMVKGEMVYLSCLLQKAIYPDGQQ